jgi:hypothetical protein
MDDTYSYQAGLYDAQRIRRHEICSINFRMVYLSLG